MEDTKGIIAVSCAACLGILVFLFILLGWDSVDITNWGLKCNKISKACDYEIYAPGRYLVGPFNHFIEFPGALKTIEFSNLRTAQGIIIQQTKNFTFIIGQPLKTRTKEGLSLGLHVSFQYQLVRKQISQLYSMNNLNYEQTFVRIARDIILQAAGSYEAPKFWQQRGKISQEMNKLLNQELNKAHANCVYLQILDIELPEPYEQSIVLTQVETQNKNIKQFEQEAQRTLNEISVLKSQNDQEIFTINAQAQADSYAIQQNARAQSNKMLIDAETEAYQQIKEERELSDGEFQQLVYYQSLLTQANSKLLINTPALSYQIRGGA